MKKLLLMSILAMAGCSPNKNNTTGKLKKIPLYDFLKEHDFTENEITTITQALKDKDYSIDYVDDGNKSKIIDLLKQLEYLDTTGNKITTENPNKGDDGDNGGDISSSDNISSSSTEDHSYDDIENTDSYDRVYKGKKEEGAGPEEGQPKEEVKDDNNGTGTGDNNDGKEEEKIIEVPKTGADDGNGGCSNSSGNISINSTEEDSALGNINNSVDHEKKEEEVGSTKEKTQEEVQNNSNGGTGSTTGDNKDGQDPSNGKEESNISINETKKTKTEDTKEGENEKKEEGREPNEGNTKEAVNRDNNETTTGSTTGNNNEVEDNSIIDATKEDNNGNLTKGADAGNSDDSSSSNNISIISTEENSTDSVDQGENKEEVGSTEEKTKDEVKINENGNETKTETADTKETNNENKEAKVGSNAEVNSANNETGTEDNKNDGTGEDNSIINKGKEETTEDHKKEGNEVMTLINNTLDTLSAEKIKLDRLQYELAELLTKLSGKPIYEKKKPVFEEIIAKRGQKIIENKVVSALHISALDAEQLVSTCAEQLLRAKGQYVTVKNIDQLIHLSGMGISLISINEEASKIMINTTKTSQDIQNFLNDNYKSLSDTMKVKLVKTIEEKYTEEIKKNKIIIHVQGKNLKEQCFMLNRSNDDNKATDKAEKKNKPSKEKFQHLENEIIRTIAINNNSISQDDLEQYPIDIDNKQSNYIISIYDKQKKNKKTTITFNNMKVKFEVNDEEKYKGKLDFTSQKYNEILSKGYENVQIDITFDSIDVKAT